MKRILIVDEQPAFVENLKRELNKELKNASTFLVKNHADLIPAIEKYNPELILINFKLTTYDYLMTLAFLKKKGLNVPVLFYNDEEDERMFFKQGKNFFFSGLKKMTAMIRSASEKSLSEDGKFSFGSMSKETLLFKRLNSLLHNFPDLILIQDNEGRFIDYFASKNEVLPVSPEKLLLKKVKEVFPIGLASKLEQMRALSKTKQSVQETEMSIARGSIISTLHFRFFPFEEDKTAIIIQDITKRKKIESALLRKSAITDFLDLPVIALDLSFKFTFMNKAAESLCGLKPNQVIGKPFDQCFKLLPEQNGYESIKKDLQTTGKWSGEVIALKTQPENETVHFVLTMLKNSKGTPVGLIGVNNIVKKEIILTEFDEQTLPFLSHLSDGVIIINDGLIQYSNNAVSRLIGYDAADVVGKQLIHFIEEEDSIFIQNYLIKNDQAENFVPGLFGVKLQHKNGINQTYAELTFDEFLYRGVSSILVVVKEMQTGTWSSPIESLIVDDQNNDNFLQTAFTAYFNHDIRTSLNGILGFADILRDELKEIKEKSYYQYADKIFTSGKRLLTLIDQNPNLNKLDQSVGLLDIKEIQLSPLINEVIELLQPTAKKKNISIVSSGIIKNSVIADENRLFEAINNVIGNAIERSTGDPVTVNVIYLKGKNKAQVIIRDSGAVLSFAQLSAITLGDTEKSFSIDDADKPNLFRLTIAKRLIDFMKSTFEITSSAEEGTKAVITLSAAEISRNDVSVQETIFFASSNELMFLSKLKPRILVVEDDESSRKMLEVTLNKVAILRMSENGEEALERVSEMEKDGQLFDVVLMDIGLPEPWDGIRLRAEILRRWAHYRNIPFIAQTAFVLKTDRDNIVEAGFRDYLSKPVDRKFLIKTIYNLLKKNK